MAVLAMASAAFAPSASAQTDPAPDDSSARSAPVVPAFQRRFDFGVYSNLDFDSNIGVKNEASEIQIAPLDFFIRANVNRRISGLSETLFGLHGSTAMVHVARLFVDGEIDRRLVVRIGQYDAPIGWYVTNYPHGGAVFRTAIDRPRLLSLEDGETMLALHMIGVMTYGSFPLSGGHRLAYDLAYGEDGIHYGASHAIKPMAGRFAWRAGGALEGLEVGTSAFVDRVHLDHFAESHSGGGGHGGHTTPTTTMPTMTTMPTGTTSMTGMTTMTGTTTDPMTEPTDAHGHGHDDEEAEFSWRQVAAVYVVHHSYPLDVTVEGFYTRHGEDFVGGAATPLLGAHAIVGYSVGQVMPYGRVQYFTRKRRDPLYSLTAPTEFAEGMVGTSVTAAETLVFRAELAYQIVTRQPRVQAQVAFGF